MKIIRKMLEALGFLRFVRRFQLGKQRKNTAAEVDSFFKTWRKQEGRHGGVL
jgi:hypothetical protein